MSKASDNFSFTYAFGFFTLNHQPANVVPKTRTQKIMLLNDQGLLIYLGKNEHFWKFLRFLQDFGGRIKGEGIFFHE